MRVAIVGHVEWIEFARVPRVPEPGAIVHASEAWEEPGGGGAVAAAQLAKLAGGAVFFTALGNDALGHRAFAELTALGLRVEAAWRDEPQRRGFVHVDARGERTITVIGERLGPSGSDALPWADLQSADAVYFTAGDGGALMHARSARRLVATARHLAPIEEAGVEVDVLVASAADAGERYEAGQLDPPPSAVVRTEGDRGGIWEDAGGASGRWEATELPGPISDAYGCGDSFAAGLTYGLGAELALPAALALGARCGAANFTGRGPYAGQLTAVDL